MRKHWKAYALFVPVLNLLPGRPEHAGAHAHLVGCDADACLGKLLHARHVKVGDAQVRDLALGLHLRQPLHAVHVPGTAQRRVHRKRAFISQHIKQQP